MEKLRKRVGKIWAKIVHRNLVGPVVIGTFILLIGSVLVIQQLTGLFSPRSPSYNLGNPGNRANIKVTFGQSNPASSILVPLPNPVDAVATPGYENGAQTRSSLNPNNSVNATRLQGELQFYVPRP